MRPALALWSCHLPQVMAQLMVPPSAGPVRSHIRCMAALAEGYAPLLWNSVLCHRSIEPFQKQIAFCNAQLKAGYS